jgi:acyl-CoA synthetase (NDP forming)
MKQPNLAEALFRPRRIALVGASANRAKATSRAQRYLLQHGYGGEIYPINPNRDEILGLTSYPCLSDAPQPIDHAFIMVSQEAVFQAVRDCVALGIPCATILAGGFAESGQAGQARQAKLLKIARAGGLRILGPNSIGMINVSDKTTLSANAMLDLPDLAAGGLSLVSQSGSLIGALLSHGVVHGTGFSKLISVGNEADLGVGEIADMMIDDPQTETIILFLETVRDHKTLAAMARRAFAAGKPVITYKLGRSDIGQELAVSHTGAIVGSDQAFDAFVRHHGLARVRNFEALIETPNMLKGRMPPKGNRICIASTTGGGGAMVVDYLGEMGVEIAAPGEAVATRLQAAGVPYNGSKLVDLTIAGASADIVNGVIGDLMNNPDCDAVVMVVGSSARFHPELAVQPLIQWANGPKPLAVYLAPDAQESLRLLGRAGIATFRTPEACAEGVQAFLNWRKPGLDRIPEPTAVARARALIDRAPGNVLGEAAALDVFENLGLPVPGGISVADDDSAVQAAEKLSYPVALKIQSDDIAHKTEAGGVCLNLGTAQEVRQACKDILRSVTDMHPSAAIKGLLVQPMQTGIGEALLGYKRDPMVGPIVVLGSGGVLTEIFRDNAIRLAPVTRDQARAMVNEVRGLAPIRGYRGLPEGDVDALIDAIVNMSALAEIDSVQEAEVNPMLIRQKSRGVIAVDGLIFRAQSAENDE